MLVESAVDAVPQGVVYTAIAGLVAGIVALFKMVMDKNKEHVDLSLRVGKLEGKQEGVETLAKQVLETVHDAVKQSGEDKP